MFCDVDGDEIELYVVCVFRSASSSVCVICVGVEEAACFGVAGRSPKELGQDSSRLSDSTCLAGRSEHNMRPFPLHFKLGASLECGCRHQVSKGWKTRALRRQWLRAPSNHSWKSLCKSSKRCSHRLLVAASWNSSCVESVFVRKTQNWPKK